MKGSVQRKGAVFYAVVALGRKRKWFRAGPEIADARRVLAEKLAQIAKGTFKETPRATFRQFSEIWLAKYAEVSVKPSTFASYQDIIRRLLIPAWGRLPLSSLTALHFQEFASERFKTVSPKTVVNEIALIKGIFKRAHIWGYVKSNPAEHLERPKILRPEIEMPIPVIPDTHSRGFRTPVPIHSGQETPDHMWNRRRRFKRMRNEMVHAGDTGGAGFWESWEERVKEVILEAGLQQNT